MIDETNLELGVWMVANNSTVRFERTAVALEKHLEEWLERDGSLIQPGMFIVGRQVRTDVGPLDLLGLDRFGRWAVVEVKRAKVRRGTIGQAVDYAACIADFSAEQLKTVVSAYLKARGMTLKALLDQLQLDETVFSEDQREILVYMVGTDTDMHMDRVTKYVKFGDQPINIVTFEVFENTMSGERILVRKLTELDVPASQPIVQSAIASVTTV